MNIEIAPVRSAETQSSARLARPSPRARLRRTRSGRRGSSVLDYMFCPIPDLYKHIELVSPGCAQSYSYSRTSWAFTGFMMSCLWHSSWSSVSFLLLAEGAQDSASAVYRGFPGTWLHSRILLVCAEILILVVGGCPDSLILTVVPLSCDWLKFPAKDVSCKFLTGPCDVPGAPFWSVHIEFWSQSLTLRQMQWVSIQIPFAAGGWLLARRRKHQHWLWWVPLDCRVLELVILWTLLVLLKMPGLVLVSTTILTSWSAVVGVVELDIRLIPYWKVQGNQRKRESQSSSREYIQLLKKWAFSTNKALSFKLHNMTHDKCELLGIVVFSNQVCLSSGGKLLLHEDRLSRLDIRVWGYSARVILSEVLSELLQGLQLHLALWVSHHGRQVSFLLSKNVEWDFILCVYKSNGNWT